MEFPQRVRYQCAKCTYRTQAKELFERHFARHFTDRPYECTFCDFSVFDHSKFVDHLVHHEKAKVVQCPFCPYQSIADAMKRHMPKHRAVGFFDCSVCEFSSNHTKSLKRHMEVAHAQVFKCEYCQKRMSKHLLIKHWDEVHGIREVSTDSRSAGRAMSSTMPEQAKAHSCTVCDFTTKRDSLLLQHMKTFHETKYTCKHCPERMTRYELIEHSKFAHGVMDVADRKPKTVGADEILLAAHACHLCDFSTHLKVLLKYHLLKMHTETYSCKHCPEVLTKHALIQHSKYVHGNCLNKSDLVMVKSESNTIGFTNGDMPELSESMGYNPKRNIVMNPKRREITAKVLTIGDKFVCSVCNYTASLKTMVVDHIGKIHKKLYHCLQCPAIMTKYALIEHSRTEHGTRVTIYSKNLVVAKGSDSAMADDLDYNPKFKPAIAHVPNPRSIAKILVRGDLFVCSLCKHSNSHRINVNEHIEKIHVKKYHCKHCSEVMPKFDLVDHSMVWHGKSIKIKDPTLKEAKDDTESTESGADDPEFNYVDNETDDVGFDDVHDRIQPIPTVSHDHNGGGSRAKPYTCSICDFSSHAEWSLTYHVKALHTLKYYCNHCPAVLTKYDMMKHAKEEHGIEIRLRGPCGLKEAKQDVACTTDVVDHIVNDAYFGDHFMLDFGNPAMDVDGEESQNPSAVPEATNYLTCDNCGYSANSHFQLNNHIDRYHSKRYHCPHCPEIMNKHDLIEHAWSTHGVTIKSKNRYLKEADQDTNVKVTHVDDQEESAILDSSSRYNCSICGHVSLQEWHLKIHVERMHTAKVECEYCSIVMTKHDMIVHYSSEHGKEVNRRGYKFKKVDGVADKQEPIHTVADPSESEASIQKPSSIKSCPYCEYSSSVVINVDAHVEAMHMIKYHCSHCSIIMSKYDLIKHCESVHGVTTSHRYRFIKAAQEYQMRNKNIQSDQDQSELQANSVCSYCEYSYRFASKVRKHETLMHITKFHCQFCSVVMSKYDLLQHSKDVHGVTFPYGGRGRGFRVATEVMDDTLANESHKVADGSVGDELTLHHCTICNFTTKQQSSLVVHLQNWHKRKYVCNHCPETMTKHEIIAHSEGVHGVIMHRIGRGVSLLKVAEDSNDADNDPGSIRPNRAEYTDKNDLTGEPYKCNVCDFVSLYKKSMLLHVISLHRKKYYCNDCSSIMTKHDLILHYKDMHGVEIPSNGRGFRLRQVVDDGSEPNDNDSNTDIYDLPTPKIGMTKRIADRSETKCSSCDFTTLYPYNLKLHDETFHRKLFRCDACPEVMTKHELVQHYQNEHGSKKSRFIEFTDDMTSPDNDEAEFVNAVMARPRSTLKPVINEDSGENLRAEQDEDLFICSVCDFTTKHKSSLLDHTQLLHGKKYGCNYCSVKMTKYELIGHCQEVHDITISNSGRGYAFRELSDGNSGDSWDRTAHDHMGSPSKSEPDDQGKFLTSVGSNGTDFQCSICGYSSTNKYRVRTHIDVFHKKQYKCVRCSFTSGKYKLIQHYEKVHGIVIPNLGRGWAMKKWFQEVDSDTEPTDAASHLDEVSQPEAGDDGGIIREDDRFKCSRCDFHSLYKNNAQAHFKLLHKQKYSCNRCSVILTKHEMIQHYETDHDLILNKAGKGWVGDYYKEVVEGSEEDDKAAGSVEDSTAMIETPKEPVMLENGSYVCSVCGYSSPNKSTIVKHSTLMHSKKYSCHSCSMVLPKYDMMRHCEIAHGVVVKLKASRQQMFSEVKELGVEDVGGVAAIEESKVEEESVAVIDESKVEEEESFAYVQHGKQFKCTICGHVASWMSFMKAHFEAHHRKKYSCRCCSVVKTKFEMMQHYEAAHNVHILNHGKGNYIQYFKPVNDNVGTESTAASGLDKSTPAEDSNSVGSVMKDNGLYKCSLCDYYSVNRTSVVQHLHVLHEKKYACNSCSAVTTKFDMISHYKITHNMEIKKTGPTSKWFEEVDKIIDNDSPPNQLKYTLESEQGQDTVDESVAKDCRCPFCNFSSKYSFSLDVHMKKWHQKKYSCNVCSVVLNKYDLIAHSRKVHGVTVNRWGRGLNKVQSELTDSDVAEVSNTGESTMFDCELCDYKSHLRINLNMHIKNVHTQIEQPAVANSAQAQSTGESDPDYSVGMSDVQAMEARTTFDCGICGYTTRHRWYLKDHTIKFHKKKFCCTLCPAVFTKHVLIQHFRNVHGVGHPGENLTEAEPGAPEIHDYPGPSSETTELIGDRNTDCMVCGQTFKTKYSLQCHLTNLHENKYKCDNCPTVLTKYDLIQHCKIEHVQDLSAKSNRIQPADEVATSRVPCSFCEFTTPHKWYLREHVKNFHQKTYSCRLCPAVMTKCKLLEHSKVKHGVKLNMKGKLKQKTMVSPGAVLVSKSQANPKFGRLGKKQRLACSICPFTSIHSFGLKRHVHLYHTVKHSCTQCSAVMTRHALIKHCRTVHMTKIPDERPAGKIDGELRDDPAEPVTSNAGDHTYSSTQNPTQFVNPKFQNAIMTMIQSPTYQPVILLDRLPIDDDTDVFTVIDKTATASPSGRKSQIPQSHVSTK